MRYLCRGPFHFGNGAAVCLHGWNTPHSLSEEQACYTDHLTNCGLLPDRQRVEKAEDLETETP